MTKRAKEQHWKTFLESIVGKDLWTAHQYTVGPIGDGGKAHIPTLKVTSEDGTIRDVSSNKEKSRVLHHIFFPGKPVGNHTLPDPEYPNRVNYSFCPSMAQLRQCIVRLSPHKAPGQDSIPNVVLKELLELKAEYLL